RALHRRGARDRTGPRHGLADLDDARRRGAARMGPASAVTGPPRGCALLDQREEDRLADAEAGDGHQQAVDAHAHTARRRHAVLECAEELLIHPHRLEVAAGGELGLLDEALAL